jgi:O-acetylhomoserine/O-acetylserine sulfhydrylase-like pyridoxal-dependent enzyme
MIGAGIANKSPVTIKNVTPIARLTEEAGVIVVPAAGKIKTWKELEAAIKANPNAAPAILAFVVRGLNPNDTAALNAVTKAAYAAAPGQAAGLTYAAVSANKSQTLPITQAMLGAAGKADDSVIRQCAIDANPDLANDIATAAFVPALASPPTAIGQNDIRNTINNPTGTTTIVPGLPNREVDNSGA